MQYFYLLVGFGSLLIVMLAINVSRLRYKERISHGHRDNKPLRNAIIAHTNAIEHIVPFCLIVFVLISQNTSPTIIKILVISFIVMRLIHAIGINMFIFRAWQISSGFSYLLTIFSSCLILYNLAI
jgi:uncharacterized membrane protein YecN with MAPEG domain